MSESKSERHSEREPPGRERVPGREREWFKEFKEFSNLRCNRLIKNKKINNLLHTRAIPLPPPLNALIFHLCKIR